MLMVDSNVFLSLGSYKFFLEFAKIETLYEFQWEDDNHSGRRFTQGDFFNWPSPEFAKCWPVSN